MIAEQEILSMNLINNLPVVVFEYTFFPDGRRDFTYISPRCRELLHFTQDELVSGNLSMKDHIHPDDWLAFEKSVETSRSELKEWEWEGRYRVSGLTIWISAKGAPFAYDDGRVAYHGIISDITSQKKGEQHRADLELRYRDLVEGIPLAIAVHSGGIIRYVNPAACKMMGATKPSDLVGQPAMKFVHPDSAPMIGERIRTVLSGQPAPPIHEKYVRLDGRVIEVESSGQPHQFEGEPAVQVVFTDISAMKRAEALFFQLFQNTPIAIVLLSDDGKVVRANRGFEEMFEYRTQELQGKALNGFIVPIELTMEGNEINEKIADNKVVRIETQRRRKDGKLLSVIIYGVPVLQADRKIGIFGMYVDITQRKKVEEELKVRNSELDNFVYKVSHDLRAPLSSVLGLAHLATLPGNNDNLEDYVRLMGKKARQLDHFISDVLSHSKNLKLDLKVDRVNFTQIIDQAFSDLNYLEGYDRVRRNIRVSDAPFHSDPWRIGEIFRNLVSNAIKYRNLREPEAIIGVQVEVNEFECRIEFSDNGIGIDETNLQRIFEMFYRASEQSEGSGLGLYIVRNAVDKLGGEVSVESKVGVGTRFRITLPQQQSK